MKGALRCLSLSSRDHHGQRCALDRGHLGPHVAGDGSNSWYGGTPPETPDGVRGPWWVSFKEMLGQDLRDEIGISEDRGATLCIVRVCWALLEARGDVGYPLGHRYRASSPVTGPSPDACYELLADVQTPGGRRFCLQPREAHTTKPPVCADCGKEFASADELAQHEKAMAVMLARIEDCYADAVMGDPNPAFDEVRDHALALAKARCVDAGFDYLEVLKHQHVEPQRVVGYALNSAPAGGTVTVLPDPSVALEPEGDGWNPPTLADQPNRDPISGDEQ